MFPGNVHHLLRQLNMRTLPSGLAAEGHYPTHPLEITHGRRPHSAKPRGLLLRRLTPPLDQHTIGSHHLSDSVIMAIPARWYPARAH
jgi:hypothetical protein